MTAAMQGFSFPEWVWWIGVVEDRSGDPERLGRVRVRIFGYHSQDKSDVPKDDLPWAHVIMPNNSASTGGVGSSPTGLLEGSHVVGFFLDGRNLQTPIVLGSFFGKPDGKPDTDPLTRGEDLSDSIIEQKTNDVITSNVGGALSGLSNISSALGNVTNNINNAITGLRSFTAGLNIPSGLDLSSLGSTVLQDVPGVSQIISGSYEASSLGGIVTSHLDGLTTEISSVAADLQTATDAISIGNLQSQLSTLTSQYSGVVGALGDIGVSIPGVSNVLSSIGQLGSLASNISKLGSALSAAQSLLGAVSSIKSAADIIGGAIGAVNAVKAGALKNTWREPPTPASPGYPYNNVRHSEAGHIEEFDNTPGSERYQRYHPAGSFIEVHPDGTQVLKVVKDNYNIVMGDDYVHVEGNVSVNIKGNATIAVGGSCGLRVDGDLTQAVDGDYSLAVSGDFSLSVGGSHKQSAGTHFQAVAPRIDLN